MVVFEHFLALAAEYVEQLEMLTRNRLLMHAG